MLLDVSFQPLYDADADVVAPHGIIGQAYDGDSLAVDGRLDADKSGESTTAAQAEGAIEGTWEDYIMPSKFATAYKYSRFDATAAPHRDEDDAFALVRDAAGTTVDAAGVDTFPATVLPGDTAETCYVPFHFAAPLKPGGQDDEGERSSKRDVQVIGGCVQNQKRWGLQKQFPQCDAHLPSS